MRIPKSFVIKGKEWTVEYKWNLRDPDNDDALDGLCLPQERRILLDRIVPRTKKWPIFLHEMIHAILFEAHISGLDGETGELLEEVICNAVSNDFDDLFNFRWKRRR